MAIKLEIIYNSLVVTDTVTSNVLIDEPTSTVYVDNVYFLNSPTNLVKFYQLHNGVERVIGDPIGYKLADLVNSSNVAFTVNTFLVFVRTSLGFKTATGSVAFIRTLKQRVELDGGIFEAEDCLFKTIRNNNKAVAKASLVITPNAYKNAKVYALKPTDGSGDLVWSRAGGKTRVNPAILVENLPYNLLQYSEAFDNAVWNHTSVIVTPNSVIAPDGTLTADTLTATSASDSYTRYLAFNGEAGTAYNFSFYARSTVDTTIRIRQYNVTEGNGSISLITITNEWQRFDVSSFSTVNQQVQLWIGGGSTFVTGEVIFAWGAQLTKGADLKPYLRTTDRLNVPSIDFTGGGCPSILVEPQATNLVTYSGDFGNVAWTKANAVISSNSVISPDGTMTADTITTNNVVNSIFYNISVISNTTYTFSFYVKRGTLPDLAYRILNLTTVADIVPRTSYYGQTSSNWARVSVTFTTPVGSTLIRVYPISSFDTSIGTACLYGAQLEVGSYATSYIPTVASAVTRVADNLTLTGLVSKNIVSNLGMTWFVELTNNFPIIRAVSGISRIGDTADNNSFQLRNTSAATPSRLLLAIRNAGVFSSLFLTTEDNLRLAIKCDGVKADVFQNGIKVVANYSFTSVDMDSLIFSGADVSKNIMKSFIFPVPLSDAECVALTTL